MSFCAARVSAKQKRDVYAASKKIQFVYSLNHRIGDVL